MMHQLKRRNAYLLNVALWIFVLTALIFFVHIAHSIITPLIIAGLYSILVLRFVDFLEKRTFLNRAFSIITIIVLSLLCVMALFYLLGNQVANFFDNLPEIKSNLEGHASKLQNFISEKFNISQSKQIEMIESGTTKPLAKTQQIIFDNNVLGSVSGVLVNATLIPVYSFLILLYKKRFKKFLFAKFANDGGERLSRILARVKELVKFYLTGLLLQMSFIFVLSLIGFWIVGAPHIIFLALLCALLNLVPYVGILFAGFISLLSTIATNNDPTAVLGVIAVIGVVQLLENNVISPKVVGSKVRLNPLATIIAVIVGGAIAGISGMFLAIPVLAIINIVITNVDSLIPYSYLISDTKIDDLEERSDELGEVKENGEGTNDKDIDEVEE